MAVIKRLLLRERQDDREDDRQQQSDEYPDRLEIDEESVDPIGHVPPCLYEHELGRGTGEEQPDSEKKRVPCPFRVVDVPVLTRM